MNISKGFIIITNQQWNSFLKENELDFICFSLRKKSFKAIDKGQPIFFVEKGTRVVRGFGIFERFEVNRIKDSWEKYETSCGAESFEEYLGLLTIPNEERGWNYQVGNILIEKVIWFDKEQQIHCIDVKFPKYTVTGRTISNEEVEIMLASFNDSILAQKKRLK